MEYGKILFLPISTNLDCSYRLHSTPPRILHYGMLSSSSPRRKTADDTQVVEGKATDEYEQHLQRDATPHIRDYNEIKILEQLVDQQSIVVAETILVSRTNKPTSRYALRIIELRSEAALRAIFHEIEILKKIGIHKTIMGLFLAFRHRQYVGLLQPPFSSLRDRIDLIHRFKRSGGEDGIVFRNPWVSKQWDESFTEQRAEMCLQQPGVFNRDTVVYVLNEVISGLDYLNQKNYVHTQVCSSNVFVNEKCQIKLGSFLHSKRIGSKTWTFTGNPNRLPPEAFREQSDNAKTKIRVKPNFDTWAIGLFVLEMITGKRMHYSREEMVELSGKFLIGTEAPPTLEETDPGTVVNGEQIYSPNITDFLAECFVIDHELRKIPNDLLIHPFMARDFKKDEGKRSIAVEKRNEIQWNTKRSLRLDMLTVHTYYAQLKDDLLKQICNAVHLVRDEMCCPIFEGNLDRGILDGKYVAVGVSLAFLQDEEQDWSRDVLNISNATSPGRVESLKTTTSKTPSVSGEQIRRRTRFPGEDKDYQRCEMVFFVKRNWSNENRRLFISLLFARWFDRDLISFPDLVRVVDELEDILVDYMVSKEPRPLSPYKHQTRTTAPDSVAFITGLRRSLVDPESNYDPDTHRFNNIYVEVALKHELVAQKKIKMDRLREGDPVAYPKNFGPLYASATFYDLNIGRLNLLESVLLGQRRIAEWEFDPEQRIADAEHSETRVITTLLQARRMNPNAKVNSEIDWETSNQARREKIWGDYRRDFMFRFAKYAVPYQLDHDTARKLYGSPNSSKTTSVVECLSSGGNGGGELTAPGLDELQMQLARTRSRQEEDTIPLFKHHDDVDLRKAVVKLIEQNREKDKRIHNLEEHLNLIRHDSMQQGKSPMPPIMEEVDHDLTRLPKHNKK